MQFIKKFFRNDMVIGLCGLRKKREFVKINIPEYYKRTRLSDCSENYLLI